MILFYTIDVNVKLHFHKSGFGPHVLLAFHGIGQEGASCYKPLTDNLSDYYTIYAFDLFFHGKSIDTSRELVTKNLWQEIIQDFLKAEHIHRFDVTGFSMGGRFALATLEIFPDKIDRAFLIAPDGVSEHPLYSLASRFPPTRNLFGWFMRDPRLFLKTTHMLAKVGVVNSSLLKFTENMINTPQKRYTIYHSWLAFRHLRFNIPQLYQTIQAHHIDLYLFIGKYDKLLKAENVTSLSRLLPADRYILLPSGHTQLVEKVGALVRVLSFPGKDL
jgi:pimeloyl-ACP methyl ester carboxylesterase